MLVSQSQSPTGSPPAPLEITAQGGYTMTIVDGQVFVSSADPTPVAPWPLGDEYMAVVDLENPNAVLQVLPDGPRYLVKVAANDGSQRLPMGTYELADGRRVSVIPLTRQRV